MFNIFSKRMSLFYDKNTEIDDNNRSAEERIAVEAKLSQEQKKSILQYIKGIKNTLRRGNVFREATNTISTTIKRGRQKPGTDSRSR